jgi:hypothetical protein
MGEDDGGSNAIEQTIAAHFRRQDGRIKGTDGDLGGLTWTGDVTPGDADLGLRKIEFEFEYCRAPASLRSMPEGSIRGKALILSNGLYLWSFDLAHDENLSLDDLGVECTSFLKGDFIKRYIDQLFKFTWKKSTESDSLQAYQGILTYYQLDLLFNGLFDSRAHPHAFLAPESRQDVSNVYSVESVIKSASLATLKGRTLPLFDDRKSYSLRGSYGQESLIIDTDLDLSGKPDQGDADSRERLLSRLSYAAMEQFLRVVNSFGTLHYRTGLDHCRAELTNLALLSRLNHGSGELRRPSLRSETLNLARIESYHSLIAAKVPALVFLRNLVQDLADVSRPLRAPVASVGELDKKWIEWSYGRSTLDEAISQFERQTKTIQETVLAIDRSLATVHVEQILAELTEARKLAEIEAESPKEVVVNEVVVRTQYETNPELIKTLTWFALVLGALDVYGNFGVWLTERLSDSTFFPPGSGWLSRTFALGHWALMITLIIGLYLLVRRRLERRRSEFDAEAGELASSPGPDGPAKVRRGSHVFDYSFLRAPINAQDGSGDVIQELTVELPGLGADEPPLQCSTSSSFHETPSSGIERTKYSIESGQSMSGASYVLHIEIDRRWVDNSEQLLDVRVVVRNSPDTLSHVRKSAERVLRDVAKRLVLVNKNEDEVRAFFKSRFGWDRVA